MNTNQLLTGFAIGAAAAYLLKSKSAAVSGTKELNANVFPYIIDAIDPDGYGVVANSNKEKLQFLMDTFKSEYGWAIKQKGPYRAFEEWIMGLPSSFNIEFENYKILQLAKKWGSLPANATKRQEDKILDNYWNFITAKTFQLFRKNGISIY